MSGTKKTFRFDEETLQQLEFITSRDGTNQSEAIRNAIRIAASSGNEPDDSQTQNPSIKLMTEQLAMMTEQLVMITEQISVKDSQIEALNKALLNAQALQASERQERLLPEGKQPGVPHESAWVRFKRAIGVD